MYQGWEMNTINLSGVELKQNYMGIHFDFMINMSNWLGGYKERVYSFIPYFGAGFGRSNMGKNKISNNELFGVAGIQNRFRLGKAMYLNIDLRTLMVREGFENVVPIQQRKLAFLPSASLGLTYRFGKRTWDVAEAKADYSPYEKKIADLESDLRNVNARIKQLTDDLAACRAEAGKKVVPPTKIVNQVGASSAAVWFKIGRSNLLEESDVILNYLAKAIKDADPNKTYVVTGYADKNTGNATINERLSRERAENTRNALIAKGVPASQLKAEWFGDSVQPFNGATMNRVAVIEEVK